MKNNKWKFNIALFLIFMIAAVAFFFVFLDIQDAQKTTLPEDIDQVGIAEQFVQNSAFYITHKGSNLVHVDTRPDFSKCSNCYVYTIAFSTEDNLSGYYMKIEVNGDQPELIDGPTSLDSYPNPGL